MIHEAEKLDVINKAREWARAERRLREISWYPDASAGEKWAASRESDRTEEALLGAVKALEYAETKVEVLTFFGKEVRVGDRIDEYLFQWLKTEARKWGGR